MDQRDNNERRGKHVSSGGVLPSNQDQARVRGKALSQLARGGQKAGSTVDAITSVDSNTWHVSSGFTDRIEEEVTDEELLLLMDSNDQDEKQLTFEKALDMLCCK